MSPLWTYLRGVWVSVSTTPPVEHQRPAPTVTSPWEKEATFYAYSPEDPVEPATHWAWQVGDQWMAVGAWEHDGWWDEDADAYKAQAPEVWWRPIEDVPTTGNLIYRNARGMEVMSKESSNLS